MASPFEHNLERDFDGVSDEENSKLCGKSPFKANPSVDPNYLRVGQRLCIPSACATGQSNQQGTITAMQNDINMLKSESNAQQTDEGNYGSSTRTTKAIIVTNKEIRFDGAPVTFSGNYQGHYTQGKSYPYYADAAMGGKEGSLLRIISVYGIRLGIMCPCHIHEEKCIQDNRTQSGNR